MDARLETTVHRFAISRGAIQPHPINAVVAGPRRNRGSLYILVEVLGALPDPDDMIRRLIQVIQREYFQGSGSITGGISAALRAANELLFEENLNSPREQRGVAGVSCAVIRDDDLYLGQIGPALAYLAQEDGLRHFPENSPWLRQAIPSDAERAASPPLGVRRVVEPYFYHASLAPGDVVLLVSPVLARAASSRAVAEALSRGDDLTRQRLQMLAGSNDLSALLIMAGAGAESPLEAIETADDRFFDLEEPLDEEDVEELEPGPTIRQQQPIGVAIGKAWQGLRQSLSGAGRSLASLSRRPATPRPQSTPIRREEPVRTKSHVSIRTLAILASLIPILALSLVAITRYQYERSQRQRFTDLLQQAVEARDGALNSGNRSTLRTGLEGALVLIDEALQVVPEDTEALRLRNEITDQLDTACNVQRLYSLWQLIDLPPSDMAAAEPSRVLVRGSEVFILDRGTDRVYHRVLNPAGDALEPPGADALLVQRGETVGGIVVGDLVDMIWMPPGGERKKESLMILERNGSLLEWSTGWGITVLPLADSASWKKPQAAGPYYGNFYLLDPQQNRILKYEPTVEGYTSPPQDYLAASTGVELSGAVDMAIDGRIYVLLADGSIYKFLTGQLEPFQIQGLDVPLSNPVAICVTGEDDDQGSVYVADAGLARVVQFTKQGQFVRQFKAGKEQEDQLAALHGLYVDEEQQRIYLTSGSRLYVGALPPLNPAAVPAATATPPSQGGQ